MDICTENEWILIQLTGDFITFSAIYVWVGDRYSWFGLILMAEHRVYITARWLMRRLSLLLCASFPSSAITQRSCDAHVSDDMPSGPWLSLSAMGTGMDYRSKLHAHHRSERHLSCMRDKDVQNESILPSQKCETPFDSKLTCGKPSKSYLLTSGK